MNITDIEKVENLLKIGQYEVLYRINYDNLRLYIRQEPFSYYSGLTGALSASTFQGSQEVKRIKKWREGMINSFGKKNADDYLNMTADFGTLVHMSVVTMKEKGRIDWGEEKDIAWNYFINCFKKNQIELNSKLINQMIHEYMKHVASIMQFIYERVEEIYAVETPAIWEDVKVATPIDLFCSCRQTPKGKFDKTTINIKTSSQISQHQLDQVACEMAMWNETYGDAKYTSILRTKGSWNEKKTPTYEYKYITKSEAENIARDIKERLLLCLNSDASYYPNPSSKSFEGKTKIGEMPNIKHISLEQEWNNIEL